MNFELRQSEPADGLSGEAYDYYFCIVSLLSAGYLCCLLIHSIHNSHTKSLDVVFQSVTNIRPSLTGRRQQECCREHLGRGWEARSIGLADRWRRKRTRTRQRSQRGWELSLSTDLARDSCYHCFQGSGILTLAAVKVGKSKYISRAALGAAVQARAGDVCLTLFDLARRGGHGRDSCEDSDGEELHGDRGKDEWRYGWRYCEKMD